MDDDQRTLTLDKLSEIAKTIDFAAFALENGVQLPPSDIRTIRQLAFDLHIIMRRPDGDARIAGGERNPSPYPAELQKSWKRGHPGT